MHPANAQQKLAHPGNDRDCWSMQEFGQVRGRPTPRKSQICGVPKAVDPFVLPSVMAILQQLMLLLSKLWKPVRSKPNSHPQKCVGGRTKNNLRGGRHSTQTRKLNDEKSIPSDGIGQRTLTSYFWSAWNPDWCMEVATTWLHCFV